MGISDLFSFAKEVRVSYLPVQRFKSTYFYFAIILLLGFVAGCGGSSSRSNSTSTSNPTAPAPPATPQSIPAIAFASNAPVDGFVSPFGGPAGNIWIANSDGSDPLALTHLTAFGEDIDNLRWSPDGSKIAFVSSRALSGNDATNANFTFNLWVMNADGSGAIPLTNLTTTNEQGASDIAWSPDGRQIAYDSDRVLDGSDAVSPSLATNIWVANVDGSGGGPLTHFSGVRASLPQWSADGSKITFSSNGAFDGSDVPIPPINIWVMNADGSNPTPVTTLANADSTNSAFSPDGTKLAYVSFRALDGSDSFVEARNIWVANVDGSQAEPITKLTLFGTGTTLGVLWSPNSKQLAFDSTAALDGSDAGNPVANVWIANADGSGAAPVTRLSQTAFSTIGAFPTGWSPDGTSLGLSSGGSLTGGDTPLSLTAWIVRVDGSNPVPLIASRSLSPVWKP